MKSDDGKQNEKFLNLFRRLLSIEVTSLDDVYWLEDSKSSKIFGKDWQTWSKARQKLPTSKTALTQIKADLWSTVVKTSQHQGIVMTLFSATVSLRFFPLLSLFLLRLTFSSV